MTPIFTVKSIFFEIWIIKTDIQAGKLIVYKLFMKNGSDVV